MAMEEASDLTTEPDAAAATAFVPALIAATVALLALKLTCDAADSAAAVILTWLRPNSTDQYSTSSDDDDGGRDSDDDDGEYNDAISSTLVVECTDPDPAAVYPPNTGGSHCIIGEFHGCCSATTGRTLPAVNPLNDDDEDGEEEKEEESTGNVAKWKPPPVGNWMVNTGGSCRNGVRGCAGGIIRDHNGHPIAAFACAFEPNDILVHELQAIREGLELAGAAAKHRKMIRRPAQVIVATDCMGAVRLLDSDFAFKLPKNRKVRPAVEEIRKVRDSLNFPIVVIHVPRESNRVARRLSRVCKQIGQKFVIRPDELPRRIVELIHEDSKNP